MVETVIFAESCFVIMPYGEREVAGLPMLQVYANLDSLDLKVMPIGEESSQRLVDLISPSIDLKTLKI